MSPLLLSALTAAAALVGGGLYARRERRRTAHRDYVAKRRLADAVAWQKAQERAAARQGR